MRLGAVCVAAAIGVSLACGTTLAAQPSASQPVSFAELEVKAREACRGDVSIASDAMRLADMDGDGKTDVLFNWASVTCASSGVQSRGAGFCGMHNCSIDIYLSSQYRPGGWPIPILNHQEVAPQVLSTGPKARLRTAYQGGSCEFAKVCGREWVWNGSKFESRELTSAEQRQSSTVEEPIAITKANLTGRWVDTQDGCATDAVLSFAADGSYASYEQNGDWRLLGKRIAVVVRETYVLGDADSIRQVRDPKAVVFDVVSLTPTHMTLRSGAGRTDRYRRCG